LFNSAQSMAEITKPQWYESFILGLYFETGLEWCASARACEILCICRAQRQGDGRMSAKFRSVNTLVGENLAVVLGVSIRLCPIYCAVFVGSNRTVDHEAA
jgi:hypothetical protein